MLKNRLIVFVYCFRFRAKAYHGAVVKRLIIHRKPFPYDTDCSEYTDPRGGMTRDNCLSKCQSESFIQHCGCHFVEFNLNPYQLSTKLCSQNNATRCLTDRILQEKLTDCHQRCGKMDCREERLFVIENYIEVLLS